MSSIKGSNANKRAVRLYFFRGLRCKLRYSLCRCSKSSMLTNKIEKEKERKEIEIRDWKMVKYFRIICSSYDVRSEVKCVNDKTNFNLLKATYSSVRLTETNIFSIFIRMHVYWADVRTSPVFYMSVRLSVRLSVCTYDRSSVHKSRQDRSRFSLIEDSFKIDLCKNVDAQVLVK